MPRSPQAFRERRDESRDLVLDAGLALFSRHGFTRTSIRMLAAKAGISQGLLYHYFDGKRALLRAIFERGMEDVRADLATAEDSVAARGAPGVALATLVRAAFTTVREHEDFWRLSYQLRMQPDVLGELSIEVTAWSGEIVERFRALLSQARVRGAPVRARLLFAAIDGAAQHYVLEPDRYPLDAVADQLVDRLISGDVR